VVVDDLPAQFALFLGGEQRVPVDLLEVQRHVRLDRLAARRGGRGFSHSRTVHSTHFSTSLPGENRRTTSACKQTQGRKAQAASKYPSVPVLGFHRLRGSAPEGISLAHLSPA